MMAAYAADDAALLAQCEQRRGTASGPGGQHVNRTLSAIVLVHRPTGTTASAAEHRDGRRNLQQALWRLRLALALRQRGAGDLAWLDPFRQGRRLRINPQHPRFPAVIACCLDALERDQFQLSLAATALGCSVSQLIKVFALHKEVWAHVQRLRHEHGLGALRHP